MLLMAAPPIVAILFLKVTIPNGWRIGIIIETAAFAAVATADTAKIRVAVGNGKTVQDGVIRPFDDVNGIVAGIPLRTDIAAEYCLIRKPVAIL